MPGRGLRFVVFLKVNINYIYNESSGLRRVISVLVRVLLARRFHSHVGGVTLAPSSVGTRNFSGLENFGSRQGREAGHGCLLRGGKEGQHSAGAGGNCALFKPGSLARVMDPFLLSLLGKRDRSYISL